MHYLLLYDVVPNYVVRRQPFRSAHLAYARPFIERGGWCWEVPWQNQ